MNTKNIYNIISKFCNVAIIKNYQKLQQLFVFRLLRVSPIFIRTHRKLYTVKVYQYVVSQLVSIVCSMQLCFTQFAAFSVRNNQDPILPRQDSPLPYSTHNIPTTGGRIKTNRTIRSRFWICRGPQVHRVQGPFKNKKKKIYVCTM